MIGKRAYNIKTGADLGTITGADNQNWQIENKFGQQVSIAKALISSDGDQAKKLQSNPASAGKASESAFPVLIAMNYIFGFLCLAGGIFGLFAFWPDSSSLSAGYSFKSAAYIPAVAAGFSSFVSALIFFNFAALLSKK
jgi:hypothetical protein